MKTKFLRRVLWLLIPLLMLLPTRSWAVDYEYQMITAVSQMTAGTYVVGALRSSTATNNFYFGKATVSSGDWVVSDTYVTVAESQGVRKFDATDLPTGAVEFTFTGNNTTGFTIANSTNYLYFTATSNRKLAFASTGSTYKWVVNSKSSPLITGGVYLSYKPSSGSQAYTVSENSTGTGAIRGYANSTSYRAIYLFKKQEKAGGSTCATPTFSVTAGTYTSSQSVTLSCTTTGATIHYTTDGTTPTGSSPTYSSAITVDVTQTIKAIAIKDGMTNSDVAEAAYTIKCAIPTFSPAAGTYGAVQSVSISTTYGTNIYYTTDGTTPSTSSTLYSSAISVSESQTIKAIAVKTGCSNSEVGEAAYTINIPYTVSFNTGTGNPTQADITEASAGSGITLPDGPTPACSDDGWVFVGWAESSCSETTTAPELLAAGEEITPESDMTLYAVYYKLTSGTSTATFAAADISNLTEHSYYSLDWRDNTGGVELYISDGQRYTGNPAAWNVTKSTASDDYFALIDAHRKISSISITVTDGSKYKFGSVEQDAGTASLSTSSNTQTVTCSGNVTKVYLYSGTSYQVRATSIAVTYYNAKYNSNPTCQACVAPDHVNITGRWDRFGGETISLTATPYDGSDQEITTGITGYQWQKYYNSTWNDIAGATSATYTKSNCDKDDSGSYRCVVSTGATCSTASAGFQVKVYVLECYTGGTTIYNFTRIGDTQAGTVQVPMNTANTGYTFKVHADNDYYGNNGTINEDVTNWVMCNNSTAECTTNLTVNSGLGGTFTFTMDYSTGGSSSVEGEPEISVTYPRKTIYFTPGVWNSGDAKFAIYYFRKVGETTYGNGWTGFITPNDCGSSADIPQWNGVIINAVRLSSSCSSPNWSDKWNQTSNITVTSNNSISITGWGPQNGDSPYDYGTYSTPTYTISYAAGTGGSGEKASETKTCGVDFTLPNSAVFTRTGYTQTGWATEDGGAKVYDLGGSYTTNAAQTFYPFWIVNSHTLTWDFDGGSSSETAGTDYTAGGSVNYGTTIDYPTNASMSKTGYTFTGWSSSPATMPDDNLKLTAQWTANDYTVTWSVNNQTWTNGVTSANNHANHGATVTAPAGDGNVPTGAAMPCGTYTFMGWSAAITPTSEDGGSAPADLFTTTSPAITQETTFYAVFAEGGDGYTRATQVSDISVGSHIIIGYEADHSGAKGTVVPARSGDYNGTSYMRSGTTSGSTGSSTIDLTSTVSNESDYVFTVEAGYNTGYFALKGSDNKYIGHNGKNAAQAYDAIDADGKTDYSFVFGEDDVVTITNKWGNENTTQDGSNNYHFQWLRYNSGSPRFAIYRTGQNDPVIYIVNSASNYKTYCDDTKAYVNYNAAGGTTSCEREAVTKGTNYTVCSSTPTKTGYTFQGWLSDEATPQTYQPNATISNVQNDIVLTAQWTATTYTITYNGVKTGATNTNPTSYTVEDLPINLVAATHDQWRFDGWTDDNAGNADITTIPAGTTGNQSFTAHWTARYAVTWYVESTPTIEYYDPGATLTFPSPDPSAPTSCSEKQFVGWMVGTIEGETDDKPTFVTAGEVNADAAYHAVWANAAGSAIAAIEDNTFTQSDVSRATYCGISNGLQSVGKYVQNQSIWNASQMTGVNVKIKVYHVSNSVADVLRISLINSSGEEVVGTDLTTSKLGNGSSSAGYSSNVTLTPTTAVTGYKVSLKTKNSSGTAVGKVTREVVPAYSKYSTSCCDNNVAAPSVTATATRNSITLSWANVTDATGYKVTINGATHDVTTTACTYTESGLDSGTDYAWTVVATYNPANYCGAIPTKNTTTTLSVYGVTYNKNTSIGSGTVTMSPMPSDASTYVVGENVTAAAKPTTSCTNAGYSFNGWNTEPDGSGMHVDAGGTIAMVEGGLTLYAEWVAKRAYYVDRMHGQGDQTIEIGGKTYHCYYGDGYHTTPSPSDQKSGDACQTPHYRFVRWLTITHINNDGTQKDTGGAVGGGVQRGTATDGETYYAIWEEEIVEP